jgi:hypothetical protein
MATWQTVTASESTAFLLSGGGITNHEVFAFAMTTYEANICAQISDVTIFNTYDFGVIPYYYVLLEPLVFSNSTGEFRPLTPAEQAYLGVTGNFESNAV